MHTHTHTYIHTYVYILDAILSGFGDMVNQENNSQAQSMKLGGLINC